MTISTRERPLTRPEGSFDSTLMSISPTSLREILPRWIPRRGLDDEGALGNAEHIFIAGKTGSGKTVLTERMARYFPYVVVADFKGRLRWPGYERHRSLYTLGDTQAPHLIYAPTWAEYRDEDTVPRFYEWIFQRGNCVVITDEARLIAERGKIPEFYHACLIQGRELGISVWSLSQRPMGLEQAILSESDRFYVFHLSLGQDRGKFEEMVERELPKLPTDHSFLYIEKASPFPPRKMILTGVN